MFLPVKVLVAFHVSMVLVMRTALWRLKQPSLQAGSHQRLDWCVRKAGTHLNPVLGKDGQRTFADAPYNHKLHSQASQPAWKNSRLVLGRRERLVPQGGLGVGVHFNNRKLPAAAEMWIQAAALNGYGNLHSRLLRSLV